MLSEADLQREAAATGFRAEALERTIRLIELLEGLRSHPFLKSRVVLKGGTALNLFVCDVPRLSVDIDLNYTGAADRETMLAERPKLEQAVHAVCGRLGIQIKRVPDEHAGGKWRLSYAGVSGRPGVLELDVNNPSDFEALRAVAAGESRLDPSVTASVVEQLNALAGAEPEPDSPLTPREREVIALVAAGRTNREIAERLHIGRRTVETHILHAFQKLNVSNRTQLAMVATSTSV